MQKFETDFGKLFYCIYTLHRRQLISQERKINLKDLLIKTDERIQPLLTNMKQYNEQQVHEHLLMILDSTHENILKQDSEATEENLSIKSTLTLRLFKPKIIHIEKSTFKLAEKSPDPQSTRSSQKRTSSSIKSSLQNI